MEEVDRPEMRTQRDLGSHDNIRDPLSNSNPGFTLAIQEITQLPSPSPSRSPTPSPRSLSPSLVVTDSSVEYTGTLPSISHRRKYSGSFEKACNPSSTSMDIDESAITSPLPISKTLPPHELHDIPEEKIRKPRKLSVNKVTGEVQKSAIIEEANLEEKKSSRKLSVNKTKGEVLKLTAAEVEELTSAPDSLPVTSPTRLTVSAQPSLAPSPVIDRRESMSDGPHSDVERRSVRHRKISAPEPMDVLTETHVDRRARAETASNNMLRRPGYSSRAVSTPPTASKNTPSHTKAQQTQLSPKRKPLPSAMRPEPLDLGQVSAKLQNGGTKSGPDPPSPIPQSIPIPPMSIPTYLQLELSSTRPSPLYIYRSASTEFPYESSKVKFERLLNFLLLPPQLEQVLYFGSMACLDAWLYTFTILPLRFVKAATILIQWWGHVIAKEVRFITGFIYHGSGRFWHRQRGRRGSTSSTDRSRSVSRVSRPSVSTAGSYQSQSGRKSEIGSQSLNLEHLRIELERKSRQEIGRAHV